MSLLFMSALALIKTYMFLQRIMVLLFHFQNGFAMDIIVALRDLVC